MINLLTIFKTQKMIIGMIHVGALPGTPRNNQTIDEITSNAVKEAKIYEQAGLNAIMIENMHDTPFLNREVGPEITAGMTAIACAVKNAVSIPCGIQILAGANQEALAVALSAGLDFIRAEGFVFSHVADEGWMDSCAGELLRYRKLIGAEQIAIFTDIKKKHCSHAITADVSIAETAKAAEFFLSDGIIVTGRATSEIADIAELHETRNATGLPLLIGSGITNENIAEYWNLADGFIIGSYFKEDGYWENPVSPVRVNELMKRVTNLRKEMIV